jgi:hypothetical protein
MLKAIRSGWFALSFAIFFGALALLFPSEREVLLGFAALGAVYWIFDVIQWISEVFAAGSAGD